jgi:opacity protein-like surface antigen
MKRRTCLTLSAGAGIALLFAAVPVRAQFSEESEKRFEITPYAGYQWGGSFDTDAGGAIPAGTLRLTNGFAWGAILSRLIYGNSAVELTYLRQDTDVEFKPVGGATTKLGGFAVNYIQIGGRQEFGVGGGFRPFVDASLGLGIMDPKNAAIGSDTRFSWSLGAGAIKMFASQRVGIRADSKLWVTPVPSGDYGAWCDFFGCFVAQGTAWVTQGQVSGGLVFAF